MGYCGDGLLDPGEECDREELGGETCESLGMTGTDLACTDICTFDPTGCVGCGNGIIEDDEECDGEDFGTRTCDDMGFSGGALVCNSFCELDFSGCTGSTNPPVIHYYISPAGDDTNNGTSPATPWRSLEKLNEYSFTEDDVIAFERGGRWYGTITIPSSSITISSYGIGPKPVIHGWTVLTDWTDEGNGLYSIANASPLDTVNIVTVNGAIKNRGRFPNNWWMPISEATDTQDGSVTSPDLEGAPDFVGGEIVINKRAWVIDRGDIVSHSDNTINYTGTSIYTPSTSRGFFIQNHVNCLTELGDWMYDGDSKTFTMFFGSENPNNYEVRISTVEDVIFLYHDKLNVVIENLRIEGGNSTNIRSFTYVATNNTVRNCDIVKSGRDGVYLQGDGHQYNFYKNLFEDNKSKGIETENSHFTTLIDNTFIRTGLDQGAHTNGSSGSGGAIVLGFNNYSNGDFIVRGNRIYDTGYCGIRGNGSNTIIEKNIIIGYNLAKNDGGGIYFGGLGQGSEPGDIHQNRTVRKNIIANPNYVMPVMGPNEEGYAIYLDERTRNVAVEENILHDNNVGIYLHCAGEIAIKRNLIYKSRAAAFSFNNSNAATGPTGSVQNIDVQENIIYSLDSSRIMGIQDQVNGDPDYFGIIDNNFYIKPSGDIYVRSRSAGGNWQNHTFPEWQALYQYDQNTNLSPTSSTVSALFYNDDANDATWIDVGDGFIDIYGDPITESLIPFDPFTGMIVLESD